MAVRLRFLCPNTVLSVRVCIRQAYDTGVDQFYYDFISSFCLEEESILKTWYFTLIVLFKLENDYKRVSFVIFFYRVTPCCSLLSFW